MHNSFLEASETGKKVLVIVPHEDDEINVAGSVMYSYVQKGAEVFCAFTTNGDYSFWARTRIQEAVRSLKILGVQHAIFLGYGDTSNHYQGGHLFYSPDKAVTSPAGHQETYGTADYPDYAYTKRSQHSPYDRQHFKQDLQELILDLQADIIFCVDYDYHADHRAASILFEEVMGDILRRPGNTYQPLVFKGFAYCTSFGAPKDFYRANVLSVPQPPAQDEIFIGVSDYTWENRIRFPVFPACAGRFLRHNILYKALFQHASQAAGLHAVRIANGDAVFWQRRTDNLAYQAKVTPTSGDAHKVVDFKLVDTQNIDERKPNFSHYLWQPEMADTQKILVFQWAEPQNISQVALWGNVEAPIADQKITLTFDTGYTCDLLLPAYGRKLETDIPRQRGVTQCTLQLHEEKGKKGGLSEVGFYSSAWQRGSTPFIKLQIDDQFAYDYLLPAQQDTCQLKVYQYAADRPVKYRIIQGNGLVDDTGNVRFTADEKKLVIRAEVTGQPEIYDEITLSRVSKLSLKKLSVWQQLEKHLLTFYLKKYRKYTHIRHKYLKKL